VSGLAANAAVTNGNADDTAVSEAMPLLISMLGVVAREDARELWGLREGLLNSSVPLHDRSPDAPRP
jgi:hypothetical protein